MNLESRQTLMQEQLDALTNLVNAHDKRLDELYEHFYRHEHSEPSGDDIVVNAKETRQEAERHA